MESLLIETLVGISMVTMTVQYIIYSKKHPKRSKEICDCPK